MSETLYNGMSKEELLDLYNQRQERRYWTSSQVQASKAPLKKRKIVASRKAPIASHVSGQALAGVERQANIFRGKVFHVFESRSPTKKELERLIVENGGEFAQARTEGNAAIPVGGRLGHPNAQGYKRKDLTILKPVWITESIKQGRMLPLTEELTLYADADVRETRSYRTKLEDLDSQDLYASPEDDLTDDENEEEHQLSDDSLDRKHKKPYPSPPRDIDLGGVWQLRNVKSDREEVASETEPESDDNKEDDVLADDFNEVRIEDVQQHEVKEDPDVRVESLRPNFTAEVKVEEEDVISAQSYEQTAKNSPDAVSASGDELAKMGETPDAMHYDQDLIFKHLLIYLDKSEIASKNSLKCTKINKITDHDLDELVAFITNNGGSVTDDLNAAGITHVIQHPDDSRRYKQIHQASKGPVLKQIVTPDFIHDSLADGRLLDENGYRPR